MSAFTRWAAHTDTGKVREANEDAAYAGRWLYAVADGMGGHAAGEVASETVITMLARHDEPVPAERLADVLGATVLEANTEIRRRIEDDAALRTMGTTLTAMLWAGRTFALAHVGDSRAYLARGGQLVRLTSDHSMANLVGNAGAVLAPVMTRFLDGRPDRSPDLGVREATPGDRYLLCSDGLSGIVSPAEILAGMTGGDLGECAERLTGRAIALGGPDNITVVLIDVTAEPAEPAAPVILGAAAAVHK